MSQIRISDLLNQKEDPLQDQDFLVVDNFDNKTSYKINKTSLFRVENFSHVSTTSETEPNKLIVTDENGFISNELLFRDIVEHKTNSFIAEPNHVYTLNSAEQTFSITLPLSPKAGSKITFSDWNKSANQNPITLVAQAPNTILSEQTLILDVMGFGISIIFSNNNWSLL